MTDSDRPIDDLLAAAREDRGPSDADRARVRASLMAAIAAGAQPSTAEATGPATTTTTAGAGAGAVKWWIVGALLAAGGGAALWPRAEQPVAPQQPSPIVQAPANNPAGPDRDDGPETSAIVEQAASPQTVPDEPKTIAAAEPPTEVARPERPERKRRAPASTRREAPQEPSEPAAPSPNAELQLIRAATQALARDDGRAAMRLLRAHRRDHAHGVFALEAEGLRVLAQCQLGQLTEGRRLKAAFLRRAPQAPIAARVRDACEPAGEAR